MFFFFFRPRSLLLFQPKGEPPPAGQKSREKSLLRCENGALSRALEGALSSPRARFESKKIYWNKVFFRWRRRKRKKKKKNLSPLTFLLFLSCPAATKKTMAPQSNLSERLKAFADRFAALGRPSRPGGGYSGLAGGGGRHGDGLGAPLVGGSSSEGGGYYSAAAPPSSRYDPPQTTAQRQQQQSYGSLDVAGGGDAGAGAAVNLPTQVGRRWMRWGFLFFFFLMGEGATFQVLLFSSLGHSPAFHSAAGLFFASSSCRPCREMWIAKEGTRRKKRRSRCFIRRDGALLKPIHQTSFFLPLRDSRCLSFLPCSASSRHDILCLVEKKDRGKKLELEGGTRQRSTHASNFIAVSLALSLVPPPPP